MNDTQVCPHAPGCGGCTYQGMPYTDELRLKEEAVLGLFEQAGISMGSYLGAVCAPAVLEYRNKMEFAFGDNGIGAELALGVRMRRRYYEVADASDCLLIDGDVRKISAAVIDFFRRSGESFFHRKRKTGTLRHLVVRKAAFTGEILVNIVTTPELSNLSGFVELLVGLELEGRLMGILHTQNSSVADVIITEKLHILYGQPFITEHLLGLDFKISAFSFFQTNSAAAALLYKSVSEFAQCSPSDSLLDLYCGTGTITQILAPQVAQAVGVESVGESVEAARANAEANGLDNCRFVCGDVLKFMDNVHSADITVVDPPRSGVAPKALGKILGLGSSRLVYVSCNPASFVRDLEILVSQGYTVEKTRLHDMFPRTAHIEAVCLLTL